MPVPAPVPPAPADATLPRADFGVRLASLLIDLVLVGVVGGMSLVFAVLPFPLLFGGYAFAFWLWRGTTIGGIVSGVKTNPNDGTIQLDGPLGSVTAKPVVVDNGLSLQVQSVTGLGFTLPGKTVQPALDAFTSQLTKNYPMGIHADSVQVTDTGVTSQF